MLKRARIDWDRESYPFWYYAKRIVSYQSEVVTFDVPYGFTYLFKRGVARFISLAPYPRLLVQVHHGGSGLAMQLLPVDIDLISSPGSKGVAGLPFAPFPTQAKKLRKSKTINALFEYNDSIQVTFSGILSLGAFFNPPYIELLIEGRLYPAYGQKGWL